MRSFAPIVFAALLAGPLACDMGGEGGGGEGRTGGTAVIAGGIDLGSFNSLVERESNTSEMLRYALFVPLVQYDEGLDYAPALAREWRRATQEELQAAVKASYEAGAGSGSPKPGGGGDQT